jgi:hypothetical protein
VVRPAAATREVDRLLNPGGAEDVPLLTPDYNGVDTAVMPVSGCVQYGPKP